MFTTNSSFNTTQNTITESLNFLNYFNKEDLILLHKNTKVRIFRTEDRATELNLLNSSNLSELLKEYNIGILTNDKLIIIDFDEINEDVEELVESANTLTVKTKKGYHLYYYKKSDSINLLTQKKIKFRINDTIVCDIITGENNYVVAPGSTVVEGNKANPAIQELHTYFILKNLPILNFGDDTLTKDILNKLTNTTANMRPNIIERYPDRIIVNFHKIEEGHRNQTIVEIAGRLLHYFDTDQVIKFIQIYNQKCFEPPLPYSEVQVYVEGLAKRHRYKSVVKYDFAEDDKGLIFIKRDRRQQQQQQSEKIDPMILALEIFSDYYYCEATDEFLKTEPITNNLRKVTEIVNYKRMEGKILSRFFDEKGVKLTISQTTQCLKYLVEKLMRVNNYNIDYRKNCCGEIELGNQANNEIACLDFIVRKPKSREYKNSRFWKFINDFFSNNNEVRDFCLRLISAALFNLTNKQNKCFLFFRGNGANGKTTLKNILRLVFSKYVTLISSKALIKSSDNLCFLYPLKAARVAFCEELPKQNIDGDLLKNITGDREFVVKSLYKNPEIVSKDWLLIINSNHWPDLKEKAFDAFAERFLPIEIDYKVTEKDESFAEKIAEEEYDAVVSCFLDYAEMHLNSERLTVPKSISFLRNFLLDEKYIFSEFFKECLDFSENNKIGAQETFDLWKSWVRSKNITTLNEYIKDKSNRWFYKNFPYGEFVFNNSYQKYMYKGITRKSKAIFN